MDKNKTSKEPTLAEVVALARIIDPYSVDFDFQKYDVNAPIALYHSSRRYKAMDLAERILNAGYRKQFALTFGPACDTINAISMEPK